VRHSSGTGAPSQDLEFGAMASRMAVAERTSARLMSVGMGEGSARPDAVRQRMVSVLMMMVYMFYVLRNVESESILLGFEESSK